MNPDAKSPVFLAGAIVFGLMVIASLVVAWRNRRRERRDEAGLCRGCGKERGSGGGEGWFNGAGRWARPFQLCAACYRRHRWARRLSTIIAALALLPVIALLGNEVLDHLLNGN